MSAEVSAGFYIEVCQADNPAVRGSYHTWMPTGKSWRFHHWIWTGNAYVDEYREFTTNGLDWSPKQWLAYGYDGLDRLTGVGPVSGWQGYTGAYTYSTIGNLTGKTEDGSVWAYTYPASGANSIRPHAVITVANVSSYGYDANGNMVTRTIGADTYFLRYDVENRLTEVKKNGVVTATFGYDGDGKMVTATVGLTTTYYAGNYFERVNGITNTYYYHAGKRIAMRAGNTLYWLLTDYLGSTSKLIAATSTLTGELRYKAYGDVRYAWGITTTSRYHFTGQREESTIGLYFYNARWYDAALGRFVQADSLVPAPGDPQSLNRYSYVYNNPCRYTDPSGNCLPEECPGTAANPELNDDYPLSPQQVSFLRFWARRFGVPFEFAAAVLWTQQRYDYDWIDALEDFVVRGAVAAAKLQSAWAPVDPDVPMSPQTGPAIVFGVATAARLSLGLAQIRIPVAKDMEREHAADGLLPQSASSVEVIANLETERGNIGYMTAYLRHLANERARGTTGPLDASLTQMQIIYGAYREGITGGYGSLAKYQAALQPSGKGTQLSQDALTVFGR